VADKKAIMKFSQSRFFKLLKNKYFLTTIGFLLFIVLFSQNNLIERFSGIHELNKLEKQKEYYLNIIKENTDKIRELKTDPEHLEKFAREEYMMKRPNEDLFIIKKEKE
jgi:cell division protein FtsB